MNKTTYYFVRHGNVFNPKQVLYGRLPNFSLSERGIQKVNESAEKLKDAQIDFIFSSPMLRTRQTAKIIGEALRIRPSNSELLNEVCLYCQGIPVEEYRNNIQETLYTQANYINGQESIDSIGKRMIRFVKIVHKKHNGFKVLVVSHGDPILILKAVTLGIEFTWDYKVNHYVQPGEWLKLEYDGKNFHWV